MDTAGAGELKGQVVNPDVRRDEGASAGAETLLQTQGNGLGGESASGEL